MSQNKAINENFRTFNFMQNKKRLIANIQGDTKNGYHQKSNNFQNLFKLTQNFSYLRSSMCSKHLQSFKFVRQKLLVSLALKNVLQMSSPTLQAHLDPVGKVFDDLSQTTKLSPSFSQIYL